LTMFLTKMTVLASFPSRTPSGPVFRVLLAGESRVF